MGNGSISCSAEGLNCSCAAIRSSNCHQGLPSRGGYINQLSIYGNADRRLQVSHVGSTVPGEIGGEIGIL